VIDRDGEPVWRSRLAEPEPVDRACKKSLSPALALVTTNGDGMRRYAWVEREIEDELAADEAAADADEVLVERAQSDAEAFAGLYERYFDVVYWYCARRVRDGSAAEDAAAQIFAQAFAALPRFDAGRGSFRSWLFRIAHNVTVDRARRWRPQATLDEIQTRADPNPTPEEALLAGEEERTLRGALALLSADQRAVVELRLAGLSGAEIAETLGRRESWVNTTHFRAIARLRDLLGAERSPDGAHR
jgi:RNA polymerase sigma-70 factor (ECF subfamily)